MSDPTIELIRKYARLVRDADDDPVQLDPEMIKQLEALGHDPENTNDAAGYHINLWELRLALMGEFHHDHPFHYASLLLRFCTCVYEGRPVPALLLENVCDLLAGVLGGKEWEDTMPLPGREESPWVQELRSHRPTPAWEARVARDKRIYEQVAAAVQRQEDVTKAIDNAARANHCSFGTARSVYYQRSKWAFPKKPDDKSGKT